MSSARLVSSFTSFTATLRGNLLKRTALFILPALIFLSPLSAQNPRGSLRGAVQDVSGARVASAHVGVQAVDSALKRETISEADGEFRIDDLLPGNYRITVSAKGFAPAQADIAVAVSSVRDVTVTLKPAPAAETVTVQSSSSSITTETVDASSAVRGGVVGDQDLETLPLPARSFANIAYLVPGT